jgi:hypothetical protein
MTETLKPVKSKIAARAVETTFRKPKAKKTAKPKKHKGLKSAKPPKGPKGPGVIDTIVAILQAGGGTLQAITAKVQKKFPDRKGAGIAKTCRVQMNRLPRSKKEGGRALNLKRAKQEGTRGLLYSL